MLRVLLPGILVALEALLLGWICVSGRLVRGHDGFQYFTLQYSFLSATAQSGEIPLWMPFMTHGTVSNWWYAVQGSLLQNGLLLLAPWFRGVNFHPIFHLGVFVDEMVLLLGVWLLTARYFESRVTRAFVAGTVLGSCIWWGQPWWNFHFYSSLPLVMHFLHRFLETRRWRDAALAGNLFALQAIGNLPYCLTLQALVLAIYAVGWLAWVERVPLAAFNPLRRPWACLGTLVVTLVALAGVFAILRVGTGDIVSYNQGRSPEGKVALVSFMTYGGDQGLSAWKEALSGVTPAMDYTLYFGTVALAFVLVALLQRWDPRQGVVVLVAGALLLFSQGGFFSYLCYRLWPMMHYYRHLALVWPIVKLFLCFLAGFGFEAALVRRNVPFASLMVAAVAMVALGAGCLWIMAGENRILAMLGVDAGDRLMVYRGILEMGAVVRTLAFTSAWCGAAALLCLAAAFTRGRLRALALVGACLQLANIGLYKGQQAAARTFVMSPEEARCCVVEMPPFRVRRVNVDAENPRVRAWSSSIEEGVAHWTRFSFTFSDYAGSPYRVDHWLLPFDDYLRAFWQQPLRDFAMPPRGLQIQTRLAFPVQRVAAMKYSGISEDKLQAFGAPEVFCSEQSLAAVLGSPSVTGDLLYLVDGNAANPRSPGAGMDENRRLPMRFEVLESGANHLTLRVEVAPRKGGEGPPWLFYSDVWHPWWTARVGGREVPVEKACLAYKAIPIGYGVNLVEWRCRSALISGLYVAVGLNSLAWLVGLAGLTVVRCAGRKPFPSAGATSPSRRERIRATAIGAAAILAVLGSFMGISSTRRDLLMVASASDSTIMADLLIRLGAKMEAQDGDGFTPLIYASWKGKAKVMEFLISHGAAINAQNKDGFTPLAKATAGRQPEAVRLLLRHGANPNLQDKLGWTALHLAAWNGSARIAKSLLENRADPNLVNADGKTALMCAAWRGDNRTVGELIRHGARFDLKDRSGWTALRCARQAGRAETEQILRKAGAKE